MDGLSIEGYLLEEEAAAERLAARVRLGLIGALVAVQCGLLLLGVVDTASGLLGIALGLAAALYGVVLLLVLRGIYRHAVSYASIAFDVGLVTVLTITSGLLVHNPASATKAPYNLLLFLVIATAGLRQAPDLPIVSGVLAVAGYLAVFATVAIVAPEHLTACVPCDFNGPDVSPVRVATVTSMLVLAAALTAVTARRARGLVRRAVQASVRRQTLLSAMERYFPEREALRMIESGQDTTLAGRRQQVTVLTTDIRGFTTLSEQLDSTQVVALLNRYFEEMVRIVFEQEGALISFVGDGIWAVFGLRGERPDDTDRALVAALEMRRRLQELNTEGVFGSVGGLRIGMAIHAGEVLAGSIGSSQRREYTVIGDTVNSSARLEELNKSLGTDLLVSEAAVARLGSRANLVDRGELPLRGRARGLRVFAVEAAAVGVESG